MADTATANLQRIGKGGEKKRAPPPPPPPLPSFFNASASAPPENEFQPSSNVKPDVPLSVVNETAIHGRSNIQLPLPPLKKSPFSSMRVRSIKKKRPTILQPHPSNDEEQTNEQTDGPTDQWMDRQTDGRNDGPTNRRTDGPTNLPTVSEIEEYFDRSSITQVYNHESMTAPINFHEAKYTLSLNKHSPK